MGKTGPAPAQTNRLAREKSPYLLQHQHNPVDWFPWGEEAFTKARAENKPIFLSIGYSTCHWCHVMERESFESLAISEVLNRDFVAIKVDREERPDVDRIYMNFVQATSGHGGWPLNVFLTPGLKPFFGGTYWPPERRQGQASIMDVLHQVSEVWRERQQELITSAESIHGQIAAAVAGPVRAAGSIPGSEPINAAAKLFKEAFDPQHGGFGSAPKFPQPSMPRFVLRHAWRTGDKEAARMVLHTCDHMAAGGIYDQLGGGFSRYSVDERWLVPHFEKMLYDNAQLAQLYLDVYSYSEEERYAVTARGILEYVLRDMTHPGGGFYSAEDADSEGHEGKFYCWTLQEIKEVLTAEEAAVAEQFFGVSEQGNFVDHSHPAPLMGQNVLSIVNPEAAASNPDLLQSAMRKLFNARSKRIRPHLDDKILSSWNGLMLGAFARASAVLGEPRYLAAAQANAAFVQRELWDAAGGRLYHRWRDGQRDKVQLLEAYAFMLDGLLHLYEATLSPGYLEWAITLGRTMIELFYDRERGGFWQAAECPDLIMRMKPEYDGAEPSGNSVAAYALLKLAEITGLEAFRQAADKTLELFGERLDKVPAGMPYMLQALDLKVNGTMRVVMAAPGEDSPDKQDAATMAMLQAVHSAYRPDMAVLGTRGPVVSFVKTLKPAGKVTAYPCTGTECKAPVVEPQELAAVLRAR